MTVELLRFRAGEGLERDIANAVLDAVTDDLPVGQAVIDVLVDNAVTRYSDKITAMLRRGGIEIEDGKEFTPETLLEVINKAVGYDIDNVSVDGIVDAVDAEISRRVSEATGLQVDTVLSVDALKRSIIEAIGDASTLRGAAGVVNPSLLRRLRDANTWKNSGYDKKTVLNAMAQRRYRKNNVWTWD